MMLLATLYILVCASPFVVQGWKADRQQKFYDYPARVFAGARVMMVNDYSKIKNSPTGKTSTSDMQLLHLSTFLMTGGAEMSIVAGCKGKKVLDLAEVDVVFSVHPVAPYFKGVSLHSDAWVDRVRRELVSCISPPDYWKIVLLIDGYLVAQDTSKPYVEKLTTVGKKPLNASSLERVYENILMRANALKFEPVPHKAGMMMPLPPILEKGKAVVKDKLYTFGGFWEDFGSLYRKAVIYDISKSYVEPIKEFDLPNDFPVGTQASTTDGRYIYIAGGQPNPGCSVGSAVAYRFDTETEAFLRLPDLPFHPNSGMLAYLSGSRTLHFTGGSINRSVSLFDYAPHVILNLPESTAFYDLWAAGKTSWKWKQGPPLLDTPRLHHISVVLKDSAGKEALYVMAGVKNDATISADPKDLEISPLGCVTWLGEPDIFTVFKYTPEKREKWLRMPDLPISLSHADPSVVPVLGGMGILIFGGETTLLGPKRKVRKSERKVSNEKMSVIRHIILYVPALDISRVVGYLPKWFRGEGVKALMAIRERAPLPSGGTDNGGILLFGGEMGKNGEPYPVGPFIGEDMARVSLTITGNSGEVLEAIG